MFMIFEVKICFFSKLQKRDTAAEKCYCYEQFVKKVVMFNLFFFA